MRRLVDICFTIEELKNYEKDENIIKRKDLLRNFNTFSRNLHIVTLENLTHYSKLITNRKLKKELIDLNRTFHTKKSELM